MIPGNISGIRCQPGAARGQGQNVQNLPWGLERNVLKGDKPGQKGEKGISLFLIDDRVPSGRAPDFSLIF